MNVLDQKVKSGGGVFPETVRITAANAITTVGHFAHALEDMGGISPITDMRVIGSAGKAETSGDIDIAVTFDGDLNDLYESLLEFFPKEYCKKNKGFNQVSVQYPIYESTPVYDLDGGLPVKTDRFVQIDLMLVDDLSYAEFTYGRERAAQLIMGSVAANYLPRIERIEADKKYITRFYFSPSDGLTRGVQVRNRSATNEDGWAKSGKYIQSTKIHLHDPVIESMLLFGPHMSPEDLQGHDTAFHLIGVAALGNVLMRLDPDDDRNKYILCAQPTIEFDISELKYVPFTYEELRDLAVNYK